MGETQWKSACQNLDNEVETLMRKFSLPHPVALYFAARKYADSESMRWFDEKLTLLFRHGGHEFFSDKKALQ